MFEKPCPNCGSKAMYYLYSMSTALAVSPAETNEDGNIIISPDPNTYTDYYVCKKCGKYFDVVRE